MTWEVIETAPKDGTEILVFDEGAIFICSWLDDEPHGSGWYDSGFIDPPPTHWMPLPEPPEAA